MSLSVIRIIVGAICLIAPTTISLGGENSRRAASELAVIAGDLRKLENDQLSPAHLTGLVERINGSLAALEILLRLADQELGRTPVSHETELTQLRDLWRQRNWVKMTALIANQTAIHPFDTTNILGLEPTSSGLQQAKALHEDLCAGCHDDPDPDTERPAYNLFDEARIQSPTEFIARMMVGVRGDRITGIDNPLDDAQISALYRYYQTDNSQR